MRNKIPLKLMDKEFNFHNFHLLINYSKPSAQDLNNFMVEDLVIMVEDLANTVEDLANMGEDLANMEKEDMVAHSKTNLKRNVI
jgi:hypothetical protein